MDNITPKIHAFSEKVKTCIKTKRTFNFLVIDIILILSLLCVYYYGGIENDRSMSICLLGTYIVVKFFLNALHMCLYPFKCGLEICI
jgi:hypothetical protein